MVISLCSLEGRLIKIYSQLLELAVMGAAAVELIREAEEKLLAVVRKE